MPGGKEDTEAMGQFVAACDRIRAETGAAVAVVHHSGKDASRGSRGSTVLPAAVDTAISVVNESGLVTAEVVKARDGASGKTFQFTLAPIELGTDEDGDAVTSCVVIPADGKPVQAKAGRKLSDRQKLAMTALTRLLADRGETPPLTFNLPSGVMTVPLAIWREELGRCGAIERDTKNERQDFRRIREALQAHHYIAMRDEHVWSL
jgi:hypothetical protein